MVLNERQFLNVWCLFKSEPEIHRLLWLPEYYSYNNVIQKLDV